ncbi:CHAT domain-containing protein [Ruegeria arenilitoris]|uniref:CHAT domain-containing protein n=2 Tax=Ruegeria arenilitoris TaxID=1173585 RepID=UPI00147D05A4
MAIGNLSAMKALRLVQFQIRWAVLAFLVHYSFAHAEPNNSATVNISLSNSVAKQQLLSSAERLSKNPNNRMELIANAFIAAQVLNDGSTSDALRIAALRHFTKSAHGIPELGEKLSKLFRHRIELRNLVEEGTKQLQLELSRPKKERDAEIVEGLLRIVQFAKNETTAIDAVDLGEITVGELFSNFEEMANIGPPSLNFIQALLSSDEALMFYLVESPSVYLWVVRSFDVQFFELGISSDELRVSVTNLRTGLDLTGVSNLFDIPRFDDDLAYEMYKKLWHPAKSYLSDVEHILLVLDGELTSFPFGVLLQEPAQGVPYSKMDWLAKRHSMSVLPSVSSLPFLRDLGPGYSKAPKPFIGFGDPELNGSSGSKVTASASEMQSGGLFANPRALDKLPALPNTARELGAIANLLGAGSHSLFLRTQATEAQVKEMDLSQFRTIAFATHALVADELSEVSPPGLVLSPPSKATLKDDGFLSSWEIQGLNLDADLVILSACNTAASDGSPGAQALSGLAKSFFYAGARRLLVSHWSVETSAAERIVEEFFVVVEQNPTIGFSTALKRSMAKMIGDSRENPSHTHPAFWAPFILVGDGHP